MAPGSSLGAPGLRVRRVRAHLLVCELEEPLEFSFGARRERAAALLEVETQDGLVGWGEANWGGTRAGGKALLALVEERLGPALIGRQPLESAAVWSDLSAGEGSDGGRVSALGAVDTALWDLAGQAAGRPVCELLGGSRREVRGYASALMIGGLTALAQEAGELAAQGWRGVKLRIGRDPREDARRVAAVRSAVGPEVEVLADANGAYNRAEALRVGRALEEFGLAHLEEPLPKWDIEGYVQLSRALKTPLAGAECLGLHAAKEYLARGACQVVLPDVTVSGFTELRRIIDLADAFNAEVRLHNFEAAVGLAATLQAAAAFPGLSALQEVDRTPNPLREALLEELLHPSRGVFSVPSGPGLGVRVDRRALERYRVAQARFPA